MPQVISYAQNMTVDTYAFMVPLAPAAGTYCYAIDQKSYYVYNGKGWIASASGGGSPPTAVPCTGAGSGASVTLVGNNKGGRITFVLGTGGVASGAIMVLTLSGGVGYPSSLSITYSAGNSNFAGVLGNIYCQNTASTAKLYLNGLVLSAGKSYIGYCHIDGF